MDSNIIFSYTWDNAIDDGTFINVTETAKELFKFPVAVTSNLFHTYIKDPNPTYQDGRLWDLLWMLHIACKMQKQKDSMIVYKVMFKGKTVEVMAVCEARGPDNPEPVLTIMLPEDR